MLKNLKSVIINGKEYLPIFEGGKGIGFSNAMSSGHFAKNNAIGTFSGVNPDFITANGDSISMTLNAKSRLERRTEMLEWSIKAIVSQAKAARDIAGNMGRVHMNVLWEMGGTEYILNEALAKTKGLIQGVICGAGMPYKLGEICAKYKTFYFPIVSSARTFKILWKRSFNKTKEWLGGVVYECPWQAGGHNGLSNAEDPFIEQDPYSRVVLLREAMNELGLNTLPIIIAGGVWNLTEQEKFLNNEEVGNVAFQFGTRPIVTVENPAPMTVKKMLLNLKREDIKTNNFSPTGFYSSAINTTFLQSMYARLKREFEFSDVSNEEFTVEITAPNSTKQYFAKATDVNDIKNYFLQGYTIMQKTPDNTVVLLNLEESTEMKENLRDCHGCLSQCRFSSWSQYFPENSYNTGKLPDCRSFCIQKALRNAKDDKNFDKQLVFSGSIATRFAGDPMYANGYIPTTKELIEALVEGK